MKFMIVLSVVFGLTLGYPNFHPLSQEMVDYINSLDLPWKARKNFHESQLSHVKGMLGAILDDRFLEQPPPRSIQISQNIPATFDARDYWPECPSIGLIRDQGDCGSCWALAAVEAISDRICIASKGMMRVNISAEDLVGCCVKSYEFGCNGCVGGGPHSGWKYWVERGLVTGDLYRGGGCQPFSLPPSVPCENFLMLTGPKHPECTKKCQPGYPSSYEDDLKFGESFYRIGLSVKEIQSEILQNGPVTAGLFVYNDFFNYGHDVYILPPQNGTDKSEGHLVKLLGWGTEKGVDYWLAANSWNTCWGNLGGFFKIRRGTNECGIESSVYAGIPKLP